MRVLVSLFIAAISLGLGSCGRDFDTVSADDTSCRPGQALISVRDGYVRRVCGCAEGEGRVDPPAVAACTITAGQIVFFSFASASGPHQILSVGAPSFTSSGVSDSSLLERSLRSHAVRFGQPGTYDFEDAFNALVRGSIIVL